MLVRTFVQTTRLARRCGVLSVPHASFASKATATANANAFPRVVEKFMDIMGPPGVFPLYTPGYGWDVVRPKQDEELYHWTNEEKLPNQVVRVECVSPIPRLKRFFELHFQQGFALLHQFDTENPNHLPEPYKRPLTDDEYDQVGPRVALDGQVMPNDPYTIYYGTDVPPDWLLAFKMVRWPQKYEVDYYVDYFQFFKESQAMKEYEADSNVQVEDRTGNIRTLEDTGPRLR